jgi:hypothetical protein
MPKVNMNFSIESNICEAFKNIIGAGNMSMEIEKYMKERINLEFPGNSLFDVEETKEEYEEAMLKAHLTKQKLDKYYESIKQKELEEENKEKENKEKREKLFSVCIQCQKNILPEKRLLLKNDEGMVCSDCCFNYKQKYAKKLLIQ